MSQDGHRVQTGLLINRTTLFRYQTRQTSISELQISVDLKAPITSGGYAYLAGNFTFQVSEPTIAVVLHDKQGVVPSGSSRYIGTKVNFEIQTNLDSIVSQRGVSVRKWYYQHVCQVS